MKEGIILLLILFLPEMLCAQYAPQAGIPGSDAVPASVVSVWATHCYVERGFIQISDPSLGKTTSGDSTLAVGAPDHFVVSLGDSGVATLSFAYSFRNGPGADLVVFENGFLHPTHGEEAYLELAFVEVSSDGVHFFRFPAVSLIQDSLQIAGAGEFMNARKLHNLAGKYISGYGTPFDLDDLPVDPLLDPERVKYVRIVDVIGDVHHHASLDDFGRMINDPFPTPYITGGFDLDAVGVFYPNYPVFASSEEVLPGAVFPNPTSGVVNFRMEEPLRIILRDVQGRILLTKPACRETELFIGDFPTGLYLLDLLNDKGRKWTTRIIKL